MSHQVLYLVHLTSSNTSATTGSTPLDVVLRLAFERTAVVRMDLAVVCGLVHTDVTFIYSVKRETSGTYQVGVTGGQVNTYMDYSTFHILSYHWFCLHNLCEWLGGHGWPKTKHLYKQCQGQNPITVMRPAAQPPCHQCDPFEFTRPVTFNWLGGRLCTSKVGRLCTSDGWSSVHVFVVWFCHCSSVTWFFF